MIELVVTTIYRGGKEIKNTNYKNGFDILTPTGLRLTEIMRL